MSGSHTKDDKEYSCLPFVLPYCQQYVDKFKFLLIEPLLIRFSSGFLPRSFFHSLVMHFRQEKPDGWTSSLDMHFNRHCSNVMTFLLPNNLYLRLQDKMYYLEIQVRHYQHCQGEFMLKELEVLCRYLYKVCYTLKFDYGKLQFGFLCQHGKWDDEGHMAVLLEPSLSDRKYCHKQTVVLPFMNDEPSSHKLVYCEKCHSQMHCKKCLEATKMGDLHKLWFQREKVSHLLCT